MSENGNGSADALRALEEIRELRKDQTAAFGSFNAKLSHIEGMVGGQVERSSGLGRRCDDLERRAERAESELSALKLDVATAKAGGAPLQKLGWVIITAIVLGFGGLIATSMLRPQVPPHITVQMPASVAP